MGDTAPYSSMARLFQNQCHPVEINLNGEPEEIDLAPYLLLFFVLTELNQPLAILHLHHGRQIPAYLEKKYKDELVKNIF
jgi:hypothetical protein